MPGLQDLERFKQSFRTIGDETGTLGRRGELYEELPLPEGKLDEDLASLIAGEDESELESSETETAPEPAGEPGLDEGFDFSAFLDSIPDNADAEKTGAEEAAGSPEEPPVAEEEAAEESDFSFPDDLLAGFADDVENAAPDSGLPATEEFSLSGLDEPNEESADSIESGPVGLEAPPTEELPTEEEGFDLAGFPSQFDESSAPDDGEFAIPGFEDEAPPPAGEESPTDHADEGFSLFSEEAPPAQENKAPEPGFSIPDFNLDAELDHMGLGEEAKKEAPVDEFGNVADDADVSNVPLDSFDTFSLNDDFMSSGFENEDAGSAKSMDDDFATLEDFSLEGIDDAFRAPQAPSTAAPSGMADRRKAALPAAAQVEEIILSEDDYGRLQNTLAAYPLNLRIACEELVAEHAVPPDQMSALIKLLVKGAAARETALLAGRLIGRPIVIPKGFEKSSGEELEAEKRSFSYMFVHTILPVLRVFLFAGLVTASMAYLGIEFVYKPLRANSLYAQGYNRVQAGEYARGNERFDEAGRIWRIKKWYFRYAETFIEKRQYLLAEQKYDQLLANYPRDKQGALDYAAFESKVLRNFEKAERILRHQILDYQLEDKEALLALGDNNLEWGELDPSRYEEARKAFARLMGRYGSEDQYLERMLLYFIRTDSLAETLPLQAHFLSSKRRKISSATLSELGGYFLDKKTAVTEGVPDRNLSRIENIKELLQEAVRRDAKNPEAYYHLTRYFERFGKPAEEKRAAERAIEAFAAAPESSAKRASYRIDAHRRLASLLVKEKEFLSAEERLLEGIRLYEDALARRLLGRKQEFGRLYADLGDIEYFKAGDLDAAVDNYQEAERNGWAPPEIRYRVGYAAYARENWGDAVESLFKAASESPLNRRILFALGNSLYRRGDLHAAQGYYNRLLDLLETERSRFPVLLPNERPDHADLAERLMRARNNLGVTLEDLAERTGDSRYKSRALALYSESARAWDALTREPATMVRSGSTNLAFLNTRGSLYPDRRFEPQIYAEIDKDGLEPSTWEELLSE